MEPLTQEEIELIENAFTLQQDAQKGVAEEAKTVVPEAVSLMRKMAEDFKSRHDEILRKLRAY